MSKKSGEIANSKSKAKGPGPKPGTRAYLMKCDVEPLPEIPSSHRFKKIGPAMAKLVPQNCLKWHTYEMRNKTASAARARTFRQAGAKTRALNR